MPVVSIVIFGDANPNWAPAEYREGQFGSFDGCTWLPVKLLGLASRLAELESNDNLFALFIAAHLEALASRNNLGRRQEAKFRLLSNLQSRRLDPSDGQEWYRLLDWLLKLPEAIDTEVHRRLSQQQTEDPMKYVSFAERQGREEGIKEGKKEGKKEGINEGIKEGKVEGAKETLRVLIETRYGSPGVALVDNLGDRDLDELTALTRAVALALARAAPLSELETLFAPIGNGNSHPSS